MNLIAAVRGEYSRGEKLLWISVTFKAFLYGITLLTSISSSATASAAFLVLACLGQFSLFLLRLFGDDHLRVAERLRRLAMLQDGIGRPAPAFKVAALAANVWPNPEQQIPQPYYFSHEPKGPRRLVDIVAECAFFSGNISNAAWRLFAVVSIGATAILLTCLILLVIFAIAGPIVPLVAKAVLIGITFWMTEDVIQIALDYRNVASACDDVLQTCSQLLDQPDVSYDDAYFTLSAYDTAVSNAPPLPSRIYRSRAARLSKIWQDSHPRTTAAVST
jgi:hypothetical protein